MSALKFTLVGFGWLAIVLMFVAGFFVVLTTAGPFPAVAYLAIVGVPLFGSFGLTSRRHC